MLTKVDGYDFAFDSSKCGECGGKCCIGESGNIWIKVQDLPRLANVLQISVEEVLRRYVEKRGYRFSIKEVAIAPDNYACIFFDLDTKGCKIYDIRPLQCRTFPFWEAFKTDLQSVKDECIGVVDV